MPRPPKTDRDDIEELARTTRTREVRQRAAKILRKLRRHVEYRGRVDQVTQTTPDLQRFFDESMNRLVEMAKALEALGRMDHKKDKEKRQDLHLTVLTACNYARDVYFVMERTPLWTTAEPTPKARKERLDWFRETFCEVPDDW
jgi:hypothetical protein